MTVYMACVCHEYVTASHDSFLRPIKNPCQLVFPTYEQGLNKAILLKVLPGTFSKMLS
jgi:hypothetical protein